MKQAYWGFLAGVMFTAAVITIELWALMPPDTYGYTDDVQPGTFIAGVQDC